MVRLVPFAALALACSSESLSDGSPGDSPAPSRPPGSGDGSAEPVGVGFGALEYPEGPYGRDVGSVIENLSFLGWREPAESGYDIGRFDTVRFSDFYNPGGTRNDVRVIVVNASAVWCTVCRAEYRHIQSSDIYARYRPEGVEILGVLFEDRNYGPARSEDLRDWAGPDGYGIEFPFVLDPGFKIGVYFESDATPLNMVIDATTMQILDVSMGYNSGDPDAYWTTIQSWLGG